MLGGFKLRPRPGVLKPFRHVKDKPKKGGGGGGGEEWQEVTDGEGQRETRAAAAD